MSQHETSGSTLPTPESIVKSWGQQSWRSSPKSTKERAYAYLRWEIAARDPCGHQFTHQAFVRDTPVTPKSNSTTAM